jgi:phage-related protein
VLLVGGGTYLGVTDWDQTARRTPQAAVVHDLQTLDNNAQLLDQMEAMSGYPAGAAPGSAYRATPYAAQARPYTYPGAAPAGHLGDWLNQHRNLPVQDQERILRNDPSFRRLPASEQDRLVQQLHHVNQLPEEQRQRRLARNEILEHMSPQEQMRVYNSMNRLNALPADRKALLGSAFRDLRAVPMDQRATVLNSSRYQNTFSPEERGILSDVLRAEPVFRGDSEDVAGLGVEGEHLGARRGGHGLLHAKLVGEFP